MTKPDKALHPTPISLHFIAAGELGQKCPTLKEPQYKSSMPLGR
jgi:hypothetical protein